jgi:hypothetical protein
VGGVSSVVVATVVCALKLMTGESGGGFHAARAATAGQREERLHVDVMPSEQILNSGAL